MLSKVPLYRIWSWGIVRTLGNLLRFYRMTWLDASRHHPGVDQGEMYASLLHRHRSLGKIKTMCMSMMMPLCPPPSCWRFARKGNLACDSMSTTTSSCLHPVEWQSKRPGSHCGLDTFDFTRAALAGFVHVFWQCLECLSGPVQSILCQSLSFKTVDLSMTYGKHGLARPTTTRWAVLMAPQRL